MTMLQIYLAMFLDIIATPEEIAQAQGYLFDYYLRHYLFPIVILAIAVISITVMIVIMVRHNREQNENQEKKGE